MSISFNPEQKQIINHVEGGLLVLAPVGTGKTSVLSERVATAIQTGISPNRILCLTFTNKAAKEMNARLTQVHNHIRHQVTIKTFHSLCAHMLRIEALYIGLPADFVIYDDNDCFEILEHLSGFNKKKEIRDLSNKIANCKSKAAQHQLTLDLTLNSLFSTLDSKTQQIAVNYQKVLSDRHAIDFSDLIFYTRSMLSLVPAITQRWRNRFDLVQVDEVQDTHIGEYEIVKELAIHSGNLALIGDLDQTIYEWRGSEPNVVLDRFKEEFNPRVYNLSINYRATRTLLQAASDVADTFEQRHTSINPAESCEIGEKIHIYEASDEQKEAEWIGQQIKMLAAAQEPEFRFDRVAVLTRIHQRAELVAKILEQLSVPCITVDQYQFLMREEVKDALAYLHFIINPFDDGAFKRLILKPSRGVEMETLRSIYRKGKTCGLQLTDLVAPQLFTHDDPLGAVLEAYSNGTIVVFDVETTGVSVGDDIVEIAAVRLVNGQLVSRFHAYISDASDVGDSQLIHGYSNSFLQNNGEPARLALAKFCAFAGSSMLIGHNVGFDIKMVAAHAQRAGVQVPLWPWADTWNLSKRFIINVESYSLTSIAAHLRLLSVPSHHAMNDVNTTVELLTHLIPLIENKTRERVNICSEYAGKFRLIAKEISSWKELSQSLRPPELLSRILHLSGLLDHYRSNGEKIRNLIQLIDIFKQNDDLTLHSDTALRRLLEFIALSKNIDHISEKENRAMIITAHQSKGLEFDHVFIAGMSEEEFPGYYSIRDGKVEEEKRLFYVGITRAKKRLYLSFFTEDNKGNYRSRSRLLRPLDSK